MQLRKTVLGLGLCSFLYTGSVLGLGLGDITLQSAFNQPLNAKIKLIKVRDLSEEEILVSLASRDDFRRLGVERLFFLTGLRYEVVLDNPADPYIRITSTKPVTEPYLNFLLDVEWPTGTLLREYTLLLDLPVYDQSPVQITSAPQSSPASPRTITRTSTPAPSVSNNASGTYRVQTGDTMWEVAQKVRPSRQVTVNQTMVAIHQSNPDAFIKGNINLLRNGYVLQVPSENDIRRLSSASAVDNAKRQMQTWASNQNQQVPSSSQTEQPIQTVADSRSNQPEGRLILSSQTPEESADLKKESTEQEVRLPEQSELDVAKQRLDLSQQETEDLRTRVAELEAQIKTMEELVELTKQRLELSSSQVQPGAQLESSNPSSGDGVANISGSDKGTATLDRATATDAALGSEQETVSKPATSGDNNLSTLSIQEVERQDTPGAITTDQATVIDRALDADQNELTSTQNQASDKFDLVQFVQQNIIAVGVGLLALLLGLWAVFRNRSQTEFESDYVVPPTKIQDLDLNLETPQAASGRSSQRYTAKSKQSAEEESVSHIEDVLAEADIYFSLGQENKAIQLLEQEIEINPENVDARLGLLKILSNSGDLDAFEKQYDELIPLGNNYVNDQATALRNDLLSDSKDINSDVGSDLQELDLDELALDTESSQFDLESELDIDENIASELLDLESDKVSEKNIKDNSQVLPFNAGNNSTAKEELTTNDSVELEPSTESTERSETSSDDNSEDQEQDVIINEDLDLEFLESSDQITTKLDLAKAYVDMNDVESAREILQEVLNEGSEEQKQEAQSLLSQL
jgi:pilus assembly protein FimV